MFNRIDRVMVPVPNAERAAEWYQRELEFQVLNKRDREIDLRVHQGEALLTLVEVDSFEPKPHLHAEGHVPCFNFYTHWEDLHLEWLHSRGIETTEIMNVPYMNVSEMKDGDGNVIGICHEKESSLYHTPHEGALPPMFHRVLAVFLPVIDLEASIRWYTDKLGLQLYNHWGQGADLMVGEGETIVTMIVMDEPVHLEALRAVEGYPYYSLQTDNIHEVYKQLKDKGITSEEGLEQDGFCRFHIRSPEGLTIRISDREPIYVR